MAEHETLLHEFKEFTKTSQDAKQLMERISYRLHARMTRYNWAGFYLVDPNDAGILLVGPYAGSFSPNIRIPLDTGLCGAAASTGKTVVVDDVTKDPRYLSGSSMVVSEIVVPIFVNKRLAAELDIESYFPGTFTRAEQIFVEACARIVADYMARSAARGTSA